VADYTKMVYPLTDGQTFTSINWARRTVTILTYRKDDYVPRFLEITYLALSDKYITT